MFKNSVVAQLCMLIVLSIMIAFVIVLLYMMVTPAFTDFVSVLQNSPK